MPLLHKILYLFPLGFFAFAPVQEKGEAIKTMDSLYRHGNQLTLEKNLAEAGEQFKKGLSIAIAANDSLYIGRFYHSMGSVLLNQKEYEKGLIQYYKSLDFINKDQYPDEIGKTYINLGGLYARLEDFQKAQQYLENALEILKVESREKLMAMINLSALYIDQRDFEKGEAMMYEAIALANKLNQPYYKSLLYTNLSKSYTETERWQEAINSGETALQIRDSLKQGSLVIPQLNIGYAYENLGVFDTAISYYNKALKNAAGEVRVRTLLNLKRTTEKAGDLEGSLHYFKIYDEVKDSIAALNQKAQVAEITEKYESEQKQARIDHLQAEKKLQEKLINRQQVLVGVSLALLLLFAGLVYVWIKQNKTRQALERSRMQQRFLLAQLNPHFIFNALQSVQNFIFKNETETSMKYLSSFGKLIRAVLESSDGDTIALEKEVEMTRNFLQLQQLNHQNGFTYEITPRELPEDMSELCIPVMLVQPFVENAVIHGMRDMPDGKISIDFRKEKGTLKITICDNGKGIHSRDKQQANALHRSMGSEIINKRISEFNKANERKISMEIMPLREHPEFPGTKVVLDVPFFKD